MCQEIHPPYFILSHWPRAGPPTSSISGDSSISSQSYQWIVEEGAIYYVYISLVRGEAGSNRGYNLKVDMVDYTPPVAVANTAKSISAHDIDPLSLLHEPSSDSIGDSLTMKSEAYKNLSKVRVCCVAIYDVVTISKTYTS